MSADSKYAYYTLRPLFTEMAGNNAINIKKYERGTGLSGTATIAYSGDMELLAASFLGAMDDVISVFTKSNAMPLPSMTTILAAKETLVTAITNDIVNIVNEPVNANLHSAATNAMQRALRTNMLKGYGASSIIIDRATREVTLYNRGNGPASIPIAYRFCPPPVTITDISLIPTYSEAETAAEAAQCIYSLSWQYKGMAEDTIWLRPTPTPLPNGPVDCNTQLLNELVQFGNVYPQLAADLPTSYTAADAKDQVAIAAYATFAEMATAIAAAWGAFEAAPLPSRIAGNGLIYGLQQHHEAGSLRSISLFVREAPSTDFIPPVLFVKNINGKYEQLTMTRTSSTYEYAYTGNDRADGNEVMAEFACTDLYNPHPVFEAIVARNWTPYVNADIVYQSATASPRPAATIEQYDTIDTRIPGTPQADALNNFFQTILHQFKGAPLIMASLSYTYPMPGDEHAMWLSVPLALLPPTEYSNELAASIVSTVNNWKENTAPPPGGHCTMKLTMHDSLNQPVLILHDVIF